MQILMIDDNETLTFLYHKILQNAGYDPIIQTNSGMALDTMRETRPDMVLLDIMMEPLNGWVVLEGIRKDPDFADLPVIILTGKVMTTSEALKYGLMIDGFIMKPLEQSVLLRAIQDIEKILTESTEKYDQALKAGYPPEMAEQCRRYHKKRKVLAFLTTILEKQENILASKLDSESGYTDNINALRSMIEEEIRKIETLDKHFSCSQR